MIDSSLFALACVCLHFVFCFLYVWWPHVKWKSDTGSTFQFKLHLTYGCKSVSWLCRWRSSLPLVTEGIFLFIPSGFLPGVDSKHSSRVSLQVNWLPLFIHSSKLEYNFYYSLSLPLHLQMIDWLVHPGQLRPHGHRGRSALFGREHRVLRRRSVQGDPCRPRSWSVKCAPSHVVTDDQRVISSSNFNVRICTESVGDVHE